MTHTIPLEKILLALTLFGAVLPSPANDTPLGITGVNIAGGEFYKPKEGVRPVYGKNYNYPTEAEIDYFASQGMNVFRYQFLWETLQPKLKTELDAEDLGRLKASVQLATSRHLVVLLDPHNYARYYNTNVIGGPRVGFDDFADFWGRLSAQFADNPYVWFGLVNEPHDLPTQRWFSAANAAIAAIRGAGAPNLILVPGNSWTGAHSWTSGKEKSNATNILSIKDPLNYWIIEVHQYLDADNSGMHKSVVSGTVGSERLQKFVVWCREHQMRAVLGEFAAPVTNNAEAAVNNMLQSMERAPDVWMGWIWWAAGARWSNYMFSLEPKNGVDRPQMAWLRPHLSGANLPRFCLTLKNGKGGGTVEACRTQTIEANTPPPGKAFAHWEGDVAWLKNSQSSTTTITMPFKNVQVEAVYR